MLKKFHSYTCSHPVFPEQLIKETVFPPLCVHTSFFIVKLAIGTWVYFWALYPLPLIYISLFVPVPFCFDYCSFILYSEVRKPDFSSLFFFFNIALAIWDLFCFHKNFKIFYSSCVKNVIGNLRGIILNL